MPCYLVVTIVLNNMDTEIIQKALDELGLLKNKDYRIGTNGIVTLLNPNVENLVRQRYGVIKTEREARRKGYNTQRQNKENGEIILTLLKN